LFNHSLVAGATAPVQDNASNMRWMISLPQNMSASACYQCGGFGLCADIHNQDKRKVQDSG
jgi:hypothetical protein